MRDSEFNRASSYYIERLELVAAGKVVRDLGEAESWYRSVIGALATADPTPSFTATEGQGNG